MSTYCWALDALRNAMKRAVKDATKMDSMPKSRTFHSYYFLSTASQENCVVLTLNTCRGWSVMVSLGRFLTPSKRSEALTTSSPKKMATARKGSPTATPSTVQHFTPTDCCLRPGRFSYQIVSSCC
ncbi:hypothetical protein EYF80_043506 [Liparis tanakae]|uniref:Uncharacterized protein n=1 Tax=Liparis tanakae TaxID=230148 RepID=A0A4Z2FYC3_9TELE|nr:hypothetical protein EYF80_043506 [Liparis tanakae]